MGARHFGIVQTDRILSAAAQADFRGLQPEPGSLVDSLDYQQRCLTHGLLPHPTMRESALKPANARGVAIGGIIARPRRVEKQAVATMKAPMKAPGHAARCAATTPGAIVRRCVKPAGY
jgi:hypothetical protein